MKRRLFIQSGSIAMTTAALTACGGGGGDELGDEAASMTAEPDTDSFGRKINRPHQPAPTPAPAPAPAPAADTYPAWVEGRYYPAGSIVRYTDGGLYIAKFENPGYIPTVSTYFWAVYTAAAAGPAPSPAPAADGLPSKILGCYFTAWNTAYRITDVPADFNVIYLFHAVPDGPVPDTNNSGNGSFAFKFGYNVTAAQVQTCRQRGQKIILTVGGQNNGYNFDSRTKSQNFVNSFRAMYTSLGGVDGCDFNNFEAAVGSSATEMIWIAQQLRAAYGQAFAITAPPAPWSAQDRSMLKAMSDAGALTYAAPQYYDATAFNAPGYISNSVREWIALLGDPRKVVVGLGGNYSNGPSLADCIREWDIVEAAYPTIRGMFCWSAQTNLSAGNVWGSTMRARLA